MLADQPPPLQVANPLPQAQRRLREDSTHQRQPRRSHNIPTTTEHHESAQPHVALSSSNNVGDDNDGGEDDSSSRRTSHRSSMSQPSQLEAREQHTHFAVIDVSGSTSRVHLERVASVEAQGSSFSASGRKEENSYKQQKRGTKNSLPAAASRQRGSRSSTSPPPPDSAATTATTVGSESSTTRPFAQRSVWLSFRSSVLEAEYLVHLQQGGRHESSAVIAMIVILFSLELIRNLSSLMPIAISSASLTNSITMLLSENHDASATSLRLKDIVGAFSPLSMQSHLWATVPLYSVAVIGLVLFSVAVFRLSGAERMEASYRDLLTLVRVEVPDGSKRSRRRASSSKYASPRRSVRRHAKLVEIVLVFGTIVLTIVAALVVVSSGTCPWLDYSRPQHTSATVELVANASTQLVSQLSPTANFSAADVQDAVSSLVIPFVKDTALADARLGMCLNSLGGDSVALLALMIPVAFFPLRHAVRICTFVAQIVVLAVVMSYATVEFSAQYLSAVTSNLEVRAEGIFALFAMMLNGTMDGANQRFAEVSPLLPYFAHLGFRESPSRAIVAKLIAYVVLGAVGLLVSYQKEGVLRREFRRRIALAEVREKAAELYAALARQVSATLPFHVARRLLSREEIRDVVDEAGIMAFGIPNFSSWSSHHSSSEVVESLNQLFCTLDNELAEHPYVTKMQTLGDLYIVVSGLGWDTSQATPQQQKAVAAYFIRRYAIVAHRSLQQQHPHIDTTLVIHMGSVVGTILGTTVAYVAIGNGIHECVNILRTYNSKQRDEGRTQVTDTFYDNKGDGGEGSPRANIIWTDAFRAAFRLFLIGQQQSSGSVAHETLNGSFDAKGQQNNVAAPWGSSLKLHSSLNNQHQQGSSLTANNNNNNFKSQQTNNTTASKNYHDDSEKGSRSSCHSKNPLVATPTAVGIRITSPLHLPQSLVSPHITFDRNPPGEKLQLRQGEGSTGKRQRPTSSSGSPVPPSTLPAPLVDGDGTVIGFPQSPRRGTCGVHPLDSSGEAADAILEEFSIRTTGGIHQMFSGGGGNNNNPSVTSMNNNSDDDTHFSEHNHRHTTDGRPLGASLRDGDTCASAGAANEMLNESELWQLRRLMAGDGTGAFATPNQSSGNAHVEATTNEAEGAGRPSPLLRSPQEQRPSPPPHSPRVNMPDALGTSAVLMDPTTTSNNNNPLEHSVQPPSQGIVEFATTHHHTHHHQLHRHSIPTDITSNNCVAVVQSFLLVLDNILSCCRGGVGTATSEWSQYRQAQFEQYVTSFEARSSKSRLRWAMQLCIPLALVIAIALTSHGEEPLPAVTIACYGLLVSLVAVSGCSCVYQIFELERQELSLRQRHEKPPVPAEGAPTGAHGVNVDDSNSRTNTDDDDDDDSDMALLHVDADGNFEERISESRRQTLVAAAFVAVFYVAPLHIVFAILPSDMFCGNGAYLWTLILQWLSVLRFTSISRFGFYTAVDVLLINIPAFLIQCFRKVSRASQGPLFFPYAVSNTSLTFASSPLEMISFLGRLTETLSTDRTVVCLVLQDAWVLLVCFPVVGWFMRLVRQESLRDFYEQWASLQHETAQLREQQQIMQQHVWSVIPKHMQKRFESFASHHKGLLVVDESKVDPWVGTWFATNVMEVPILVIQLPCHFPGMAAAAAAGGSGDKVFHHSSSAHLNRLRNMGGGIGGALEGNALDGDALYDPLPAIKNLIAAHQKVDTILARLTSVCKAKSIGDVVIMIGSEKDDEAVRAVRLLECAAAITRAFEGERDGPKIVLNSGLAVGAVIGADRLTFELFGEVVSTSLELLNAMPARGMIATQRFVLLYRQLSQSIHSTSSKTDARANRPAVPNPIVAVDVDHSALPTSQPTNLSIAQVFDGETLGVARASPLHSTEPIPLDGLFNSLGAAPQREGLQPAASLGHASSEALLQSFGALTWHPRDDARASQQLMPIDAAAPRDTASSGDASSELAAVLSNKKHSIEEKIAEGRSGEFLPWLRLPASNHRSPSDSRPEQAPPPCLDPSQEFTRTSVEAQDSMAQKGNTDAVNAFYHAIVDLDLVGLPSAIPIEAQVAIAAAQTTAKGHSGLLQVDGRRSDSRISDFIDQVFPVNSATQGGLGVSSPRGKKDVLSHEVEIGGARPWRVRGCGTVAVHTIRLKSFQPLSASPILDHLHI